ncbi:MAG: hypothetical protein IKG65_06150 [Exiguobacterium sp.]|uniref:hypothetical protein n=1 Tax=Exiguobacterium sp. TaxID=44751 RepID=UPI00257AB948|nr:hypothetical protein [Exiguobacterium sp.]MBQ6459527.1 hypothetical protein [Exiguobacterium sp.]MBR3061979.1 hypothetical protein [Exiguobacterium sp.]
MSNKRANIQISDKPTLINFHSGSEYFGVVQYKGIILTIDGERYGILPMIHSIAVVDPETGIRLLQTKMPEWFRFDSSSRVIDHLDRDYIMTEVALLIIQHAKHTEQSDSEEFDVRKEMLERPDEPVAKIYMPDTNPYIEAGWYKVQFDSERQGAALIADPPLLLTEEVINQCIPLDSSEEVNTE